jgi:hypothetical protein
VRSRISETTQLTDFGGRAVGGARYWAVDEESVVVAWSSIGGGLSFAALTMTVRVVVLPSICAPLLA